MNESLKHEIIKKEANCLSPKARKQRKGSSSDKGTLSQYGYMCKILSISLDINSVSQAKRRAERFFGSLQILLSNKLHLYNIKLSNNKRNCCVFEYFLLTLLKLVWSILQK